MSTETTRRELPRSCPKAVEIHVAFEDIEPAIWRRLVAPFAGSRTGPD